MAYINRLGSEIAALTVVLAFFALVLAGSVGLRAEAALFPRIVGTAGLLLAVFVAIELRGARDRRPADADTPGADQGGERASAHRVGIAYLAAPVYGMLFYLAGFYISAGVAISVIPWLLGYRRPWVLLGLAAGTIIVLHALFSVILNVPIPHGVIGEWFLRSFVYED